MSFFRPVVIATALVLAGAATGHAQQFKAGDIVIEQATARATPKGATVAAGYMIIHNNGDKADRLTGGSADFAAIEVHEMAVTDGVMKMRELKDGLEIPAHATVKLASGGYHLMMVGLKHPLVQGETAKVSLAFEHAGSIVVDLAVNTVGDSGAQPAPKGADTQDGGMTGMKM